MGIRIEKAWYFFGSPIVIYPCPNCDHELKSPVSDIGKEDACPECNCTFVVQGQVEYQAYLDSRKPKTPPPPTLTTATKSREKSYGDYVENHIKNITQQDKLKSKALKARRMADYANSVLDQANSYEQIAGTYDGDEEDEVREKIVNANFLESTIKYIEYEYLLINGAWDAMDKNDSVWDKQLSDYHDGSSISVLQAYSSMNGDVRQLKVLFVDVTTKMQKSLKCPISPQVAWKRFAKVMNAEKEKTKHLF